MDWLAWIEERSTRRRALRVRPAEDERRARCRAAARSARRTAPGAGIAATCRGRARRPRTVDRPATLQSLGPRIAAEPQRQRERQRRGEHGHAEQQRGAAGDECHGGDGEEAQDDPAAARETIVRPEGEAVRPGSG